MDTKTINDSIVPKDSTSARSKKGMAAETGGNIPRKSTASAQTNPVETTVKVEFKCDCPEAQSVSVAGTFNDWDPTRTPLKKNGKGWKATIPLPKGRHEYRFVVDGYWLSDPEAKESTSNPFGESNSVLVL